MSTARIEGAERGGSVASAPGPKAPAPSGGQTLDSAGAAEHHPDAQESASDRSTSVPRRLASLDAFRGLTVLGMLLVNNIDLDAATPRHLTHADWSGRVHLADLVFPWFLFMVGVAIPWSAASYRRRGLSRERWVLKALGRAASLVLLGCLVNSTVAREPVLGLGVLQVIGLAYLVGALMQGLPGAARLGIAGGLLVLHWALLRFVALPGQAPGQFSETTNAVLFINRAYLAPLHLQGLLSVVPTSALVLVGTLCGNLLRSERLTALGKPAVLGLGGGGLVLAGLAWSRDLPMNKPLWTAPYILYTGGLAALVLGLLYLVVDAAGWRSWALVLLVPGANALLAYVAPILVKIDILQTWTWRLPGGARVTVEEALQSWCYAHAGRVAGGWLYTFGYMAAWWLVLLYLYRKRAFLRV